MKLNSPWSQFHSVSTQHRPNIDRPDKTLLFSTFRQCRRGISSVGSLLYWHDIVLGFPDKLLPRRTRSLVGILVPPLPVVGENTGPRVDTRKAMPPLPLEPLQRPGLHTRRAALGGNNETRPQ